MYKLRSGGHRGAQAYSNVPIYWNGESLARGALPSLRKWKVLPRFKKEAPRKPGARVARLSHKEMLVGEIRGGGQLDQTMILEDREIRMLMVSTGMPEELLVVARLHHTKAAG
jgi:hypothetical protein